MNKKLYRSCILFAALLLFALTSCSDSTEPEQDSCQPGSTGDTIVVRAGQVTCIVFEF